MKGRPVVTSVLASGLVLALAAGLGLTLSGSEKNDLRLYGGDDGQPDVDALSGGDFTLGGGFWGGSGTAATSPTPTPTPTSEIPSGCTWSDDFSSLSLGPTWSWVREDPTHWSLTQHPGFLRMTTQQGG
ncbi:MAG: hypothetical protein PVI07_14750, partial [Anaerolineae bacterium]